MSGRNQVDITLGANNAEAKSSFSDLGSHIQKFKTSTLGNMFTPAVDGAKSLFSVTGLLKQALGPLAASIAGAFAVHKILEVGTEMRATAKAAERLGVGVEFMENMSAAGKRTGAELADIEKTMVMLTRSAAEAINKPGGDKSNAFAALGVDVAHLRDMRPEELFETMSTKIAGSANQTALLAQWMEVAGKSGYNMWGVVKMGAEQISKLNPLAKGSTEELSEMGKQWGIVKRETANFGNTIASFVAPILIGVFQAAKTVMHEFSIQMEQAALGARAFFALIGGDHEGYVQLTTERKNVRKKHDDAETSAAKAGEPSDNRLGDADVEIAAKKDHQAQIDAARVTANKAESEARQKEETEVGRINELLSEQADAQEAKKQALLAYGENSLEFQRARENAAHADAAVNIQIKKTKEETAKLTQEANHAEIEAAYAKLTLEEKLLYQTQLRAEIQKRMAKLNPKGDAEKRAKQEIEIKSKIEKLAPQSQEFDKLQSELKAMGAPAKAKETITHKMEQLAPKADEYAKLQLELKTLNQPKPAAPKEEKSVFGVDWNGKSVHKAEQPATPTSPPASPEQKVIQDRMAVVAPQAKEYDTLKVELQRLEADAKAKPAHAPQTPQAVAEKAQADEKKQNIIVHMAAAAPAAHEFERLKVELAQAEKTAPVHPILTPKEESPAEKKQQIVVKLAELAPAAKEFDKLKVEHSQVENDSKRRNDITERMGQLEPANQELGKLKLELKKVQSDPGNSKEKEQLRKADSVAAKAQAELDKETKKKKQKDEEEQASHAHASSLAQNGLGGFTNAASSNPMVKAQDVANGLLKSIDKKMDNLGTDAQVVLQ